MAGGGQARESWGYHSIGDGWGDAAAGGFGAAFSAGYGGGLAGGPSVAVAGGVAGSGWMPQAWATSS